MALPENSHALTEELSTEEGHTGEASCHSEGWHDAYNATRGLQMAVGGLARLPHRCSGRLRGPPFRFPFPFPIPSLPHTHPPFLPLPQLGRGETGEGACHYARGRVTVCEQATEGALRSGGGRGAPTPAATVAPDEHAGAQSQSQSQ